MKIKILSVILLLALALGGLPAARAEAKPGELSVSSAAASPAEMLNPDGTLNLDGNFSGALDLDGFSVQLDPQRGPVFGSTSAIPAGQWAAIGEGGGVVDAYVRDIVVNGSDVYVGGDFTDLANIPAADYIAKWDGANWSALGGNAVGNGSLNSDVTTMAFSGSDLYVGGNFTQILQSTWVSAAAYIAKWDTLTGNWSALGSNGAGGGSLNSGVTKLVVNGSTVYAAGYFTNVNNGGTVLDAADFIAQWDSLTGNWSVLGSNGAGDGAFPATTYIGALALSGTNLYVGGSFTDVNNSGVVLTAADNIVKWDTLTGNWSALGSNGTGGGAISGTVYSLLVDDSDVYVGGQFTDINNNGTVIPQADYIAKWNAQTSSWSALGSNGTGNGPLDTSPKALFMNGTDLYVGGSFRDVNNNGVLLPSADCLAKWDTLTGNWSAIGSNGANDGAIPNKSYPSVLALAMQGNNLIVGGNFFDVNDAGNILPQADYLAQWDGSHWSSLGMDANGALVNGYAGSQVRAIAVMGADIYVGGIFSNISNHGINLPEADYIAKWDGVNWSALGNNGGGNGSLNNYVYALTVSGTDLYVGGRFTNVNNNGVSLPAADYIAKWDSLAGNWSALGNNGANNGSLSSGGYVGALLLNNGNLYVGGQFINTNNGGTVIAEADYIAKWDGANWSALGSNGAGDGAVNAYVSALAADASSKLYVGGGFTDTAALPAADYLAAWDGTTWSALGDDGAGNGSLNNGVVALAVSGSNVYAGGFFSNVNNQGTILPAADLIAKWDGADWSALGSNGMNDGVFCVNCGNAVRTLAINGTDVYIGGSFTDIRSNNVIIPAADYAAKWDGAQWSSLGSNGAGNGSLLINSIVYALTMNGDDLLVGGQFSNVNNNGTVLKKADYLAAYGATTSTIDTTPPTVISVTRASPNPTSAPSVDYIVTFSENVAIPWSTSFTVFQSGVSGAAVNGWTGSGSVYTVHITTGSGDGTLRLDVVDDDTITDAAGNPLGGVGEGNGDFTGGEVYDVTDTSIPVVQSIIRANPSPVLGPTVTFTVQFSEPVTGVDLTDFVPVVSGLSGPQVESVFGSGADYSVVVDAGVGMGSIRLDLVDDNSIFDLLAHPLGGSGAGNGDYDTGESYNVRIATFSDVPTDYWSWHFIERLYSAGVTGGCSTTPLNYCPETYVTRAQMAIFLLVAEHGSTYMPPEASGSLFGDVDANYWAADWIEQLALEGVTGGCGDGNYCPETIVTRDQMAVFLLRAKHGSQYVPPAATGTMFTDVPADYWAVIWIEALAGEGITSGCGGGKFCPQTPVTRAQMAVFLVRTFYLP